MFAIPNGGLRDIRTATNLKAEGVKSGVPDIFLPTPFIANDTDHNNNSYILYCGCFIEMKRKIFKNRSNGGCSEEQIDFIEWTASAGYYCKVCYTWEEARDCLVNYLEGRL
jgi:hypothetical protein